MLGDPGPVYERLSYGHGLTAGYGEIHLTFRVGKSSFSIATITGFRAGTRSASVGVAVGAPRP
jgi:hypothetical protein